MLGAEVQILWERAIVEEKEIEAMTSYTKKDGLLSWFAKISIPDAAKLANPISSLQCG